MMNSKKKLIAIKNSHFAADETFFDLNDFIYQFPYPVVFINNNSISINEKVEQLLGYKQSELATLTDWFEKLYPTSMTNQNNTNFNHEDLRNYISSVSVIYTKNGNPMYLQVKKENNKYGEMWILTDVTASFELMKDRKREQSNYIHFKKLADIGEMTASIGHEINNPLTIVNGLQTLISNLIEKQPDLEKIHHHINRQNMAIERITKIVNSLRVYARTDEDSNEPISIHQGIIDTVNLTDSMFRRLNINITLDLKSEDDVVVGNLGQIQQVIMNLLTNSRDALEDCETKNIVIHTSTQYDSIFVSITDTGKGMDRENQQKIFQPYFTTKSREKGTGLGMGISLGIIKNHCGKLSFTSTPNVGTTFSFTIPLARFSSLSKNIPGVQSQSSDSKNQQKKVLIVDDEIDIRNILRSILETSGIQVYEAVDGIHGLEMCQKHKFDVVISDIQMPNMDGLTMLAQLKTNTSFQSKFIIITGALQSKRSTRTNDIIASADGLLRKPFKDNELLQLAGIATA